MAWAYIDENSRVMAWCYECGGADWVEFNNPETIDELCADGLEDFTIRGGVARYEPTKAKQLAKLKANLANTDYVAIKIAEGAATAEEYADTLKQRERWREKIRELEGEAE